MNVACTVATERQNKERAALQTELHAQLFSEVDAWHEENKGRLPPVEWSYNVMSTYTRKYIQSYLPDPTKDQDVRFVLFKDIDRTHSVHVKALDFQKAQDTLYGKCRMDCIRSYNVMSYAELVQLSIVRILESSVFI
jgi:hypothetical protein